MEKIPDGLTSGNPENGQDPPWMRREEEIAINTK
jgi:hypothetical protein